MASEEKGAKFHQMSTLSNKMQEDGRVLDPDNPLLAKFQKALKEQLLRQIEHLKEDVFEYECGIKKNNAKREEIGVMVYEEQQIVAKQQSTLENYITQLQSVTAAREEIENILEEKRADFKREREKLFSAQAKEMELRAEVEGTNLLIQQMSEWEDALESDITVKKRIFEKSRKDKLKLIEEKRSQDALIYRLMTRIWQIEQDLEKMDVQLKVKEEEREEMAQTVALGNTNIEAIESEYRCLMHSWNSVVIAIGNRDKVLTCLGTEMNKVEEKFKSTLAEIEQVKKLSQKEMKKNEELTVIRDRFATDIKLCQNALDQELQKKATLEKRMSDMQGIIEQTEYDITKLNEETHDVQMQLAGLTKEAEQLEAQKGELQERILKYLEDQVTNNKIALSLRRVLKQLRAKNRAFEISVAQCENRTACVYTEIETQKFTNEEANKYYLELEGQMKELEKEADKYQDDLKKLELITAKRQRDVDLLNMKYQKIVERTGTAYSSPFEAKINALEKSIEEVQEQNKKLQQFWLREQTNLLRLSEERQDQIQNNNLLRKQIMILEQKNLKITDELDARRKQEEQITRNICNLHNRLSTMCNNFCKKKGLKTSLDKDNDVMRQDYIYKLKDAELECLKLEDEISEIEEEKVNLSNELIQMNREVLEWEKKFLSAKEAKQTMVEERGKEGEVGGMRAEIHRMNVRYTQLRRVQDVLVKDLEHCVSRRDAIMTVAEAREKRVKGGLEKTRFNFNRKLDDFRNKTKQMENEIAELNKKIEAVDRDKAKIDDEIAAVEFEIGLTKQHQNEAGAEIEEAKTQRQLNFELLLQLQKKLNLYTDISKGRQPYRMYQTESALTTEYNKQKEINGRLSKVIENLLGDFPQHVHELNRILNTLKLPIFVRLP